MNLLVGVVILRFWLQRKRERERERERQHDELARVLGFCIFLFHEVFFEKSFSQGWIRVLVFYYYYYYYYYLIPRRVLVIFKVN